MIQCGESWEGTKGLRPPVTVEENQVPREDTVLLLFRAWNPHLTRSSDSNFMVILNLNKNFASISGASSASDA